MPYHYSGSHQLTGSLYITSSTHPSIPASEVLTSVGRVNIHDGKKSIYIGNKVGESGSDGSSNTIIGDAAYVYRQSGSTNVAMGYNSMIGLIGYSTDEIHGNTSVGAYSMARIKTGSYNTAVGYQSLYYIGTGSGQGDYNIGIGYQAGSINLSGSYNIYIGYNGRNLTDNHSNKLLIGNSKAVFNGSFYTPLIGGDLDSRQVSIGCWMDANPKLSKALLYVTHSEGETISIESSMGITASGLLYTDNNIADEDMPFVVYDTASGQYHHTHSLKVLGDVVIGPAGAISTPILTTGTATTVVDDNIYTKGTSSLAGNITASGNISSSGTIYASMSQDPGNLPTQVVMWNSASGRFYHSSSFRGEDAQFDGDLRAEGTVVSFTGIPTSDPGIAGRVYNLEGDLKISLG
jgi:hypothetical protein